MYARTKGLSEMDKHVNLDNMVAFKTVGERSVYMPRNVAPLLPRFSSTVRLD